MFKNIPSFRVLLVFLMAIAFVFTGSSCSRRVYYSSKRVYNAQKEQNKRLKKKGYSNQQYRKKRSKKTKWNKRRNNSKKRYKTGGGLFKGK